MSNVKHPRWRVPAIHLVEGLDEFIADVEDCASVLPFYSAIKDIEVVGSYAAQCAKLYSDIDINIAMANDKEQRMAIWQWVTLASKMTFRKKVDALQEKWGIGIDYACAEPDNKKKNPAYSLREKQYYGPKGNIKSVWDWEIRDWKQVPAPVKTFAFETDPFATIVPEWAERYGKDFIYA